MIFDPEDENIYPQLRFDIWQSNQHKEEAEAPNQLDIIWI